MGIEQIILILIDAGYISTLEVIKIRSQLTDIKKAEELTNSTNRIIVNASVKEKKCYEAIRLLEKHKPRIDFIKAQMLYRLAECYYHCGNEHQANKLLYDLDALTIDNVTLFRDNIKQAKNKGHELRLQIKNSQAIKYAKEREQAKFWKTLVCTSLLLSLISVACLCYVIYTR